MAKSEHGVRTPSSKNCKLKAHFRNPKQLIEGEIIKKQKQIKQIKLTKEHVKENREPLPRKWKEVQRMN